MLSARVVEVIDVFEDRDLGLPPGLPRPAQDHFRTCRGSGSAVTQALNNRQIKVLNRMLDRFERKMTSSKWATLAKCSQDTTNRDIATLIDMGLLRKSEGGGGSTHYEIAQVEIDRLWRFQMRKWRQCWGTIDVLSHRQNAPKIRQNPKTQCA